MDSEDTGGFDGCQEGQFSVDGGVAGSNREQLLSSRGRACCLADVIRVTNRLPSEACRHG
jgi:hypothetical protein